MTLMKLVALAAAALLACAPSAAQNIATLPSAATLTGTEKITAAQGTGCPTKVQPCAIVAVNPAQIAAYLAPTFQPLDADLTGIAALTTQPFGRSLLSQGDAASVRTALAAARSGANTDITSLAALTTPLTVAQGGTGDAGSAWTAYVPTFSAGSGTLTTASASGRYKRIGKTVFYQASLTITTNGSGASYINLGLPFASGPADQATSGRESQSVGFALAGFIASGSATMLIQRYDASYPGGSNYKLIMTGSYETN